MLGECTVILNTGLWLRNCRHSLFSARNCARSCNCEYTVNIVTFGIAGFWCVTLYFFKGCFDLHFYNRSFVFHSSYCYQCGSYSCFVRTLALSKASSFWETILISLLHWHGHAYSAVQNFDTNLDRWWQKWCQCWASNICIESGYFSGLQNRCDSHGKVEYWPAVAVMSAIPTYGGL